MHRLIYHFPGFCLPSLVQDAFHVYFTAGSFFSVSATNVSQFAQPKKHHGQQCVRNNVSSFARALKIQSNLRACSHGGGDPRLVRFPALVGLPISPYNLSFFLDCFHMRGGVPHLGGLPGQPSRVTRLGGVSFLHVSAEGGVG